MRRWIAWLLLLLTGTLPFEPALASLQVEANLPACCRRHGAHHCMMMEAMALAMAGSSSQPIFATAPCPLWKIHPVPAVVVETAEACTLVSAPAAIRILVVPTPLLPLARPSRAFSARAPPIAA